MSSSSYSLKNDENYNPTLDDTTPDMYMSLYMNIISDYASRFDEQNIIQDSEFKKYVFVKGMEMISHLYSMILLYTRNLSCSSHFAQKGYYYYIEFLEQIGNMSNTFLKLTCKDAMLFTYRKTLFDIPHNKMNKHDLCDKDRKTLDSLQDKMCEYHSLVSNELSKVYLKDTDNTTNSLMDEIKKLNEIYESKG
jgi:hypothetical protein